MIIRFTILNRLPPKLERLLTVNVPADIQPPPTKARVIDWLKRQQPYLIEGETWEVVKTETLKNPDELSTS